MILNLNDFFVLVILIIVSCIIVKYRYQIAIKLNILDHPNKSRKFHKTPTPLIGGLVFFFFIIIFIIYELWFYELSLKKSLIFIILVSLFFISGLIDDSKQLNAQIKTFFLIASLAMFLPIENSFIVHEIKFLFWKKKIYLNQASIFFTIFSIFALYNAFNFADGINGAAISLFLYWILFLYISTNHLLYLSLIIISLFVLYQNLQKKLFLGNSGSSLLSVVTSLLFINHYNIEKNIFCDQILFLFFLPGIDMTRVIVQRIINKKKTYEGDLEHFHHYLSKYFKYLNVWFIYVIFSTLPYGIFFLIKNNFVSLFINILVYFWVLYFFKNANK